MRQAVYLRVPYALPMRKRIGLRGLGDTLTPAQIYSLTRQVGFPPDVSTQMTAIALRESGGNTAAYNGVGPDDSYGLWQINMKGNLGTARLAQFGIQSKSDLLDPLTNAKAAYDIWAGNPANLNAAWYIDRPGYAEKYQANLPAAEAAAAAYGDGGAVDHPIADFGGAAEDSWDPLTVLIGAGVLGLALYLATSD